MTQSKIKDNLVGSILLATGLVVGVASTLLALEHRPKKAGVVLEQTKQYFQTKGEVVGSWIDYDPIEYELFQSQPLVYIGGLTVKNGDQMTRYQFACDVYSGDLVDYFAL